MKIVGVTLNSKLTMSQQCTDIANNTSRIIGVFRKCRKFINYDQALRIYTSFIRPKIEYCSLLMLNLTDYDSKRIESIQNKIIRIILRAPNIFSITDGRKLINLHTLKSRRKYRLTSFLKLKVDKNKTSDSIQRLLSLLPQQNSSLQLRNNSKTIIPHCRTNFYRNSFSYNASYATKYLPLLLLSIILYLN